VQSGVNLKNRNKKEEVMKISRRTLYILFPVIVLVIVGAALVGFACTPPGTMPKACQQWYDQGKLDGYNDGYAKGKADGQAAGYNEGYVKGMQDGTALCPQCPQCPSCPECPQQYQYPYYFPYPHYYWGY
jgi:hypothetical protein